MSNRKNKPNVVLRTIILALTLALLAVIVPSFNRARHRANERACYANQKTIAGAFEMYSLDANSLKGVVDLEETLHNLNKYGYLSDIPDDPGYGSDSSGHYILIDEDIMCIKHGGIQRVENTPASIRSVMIAAGIDDKVLLSLAGINEEDRGRFNSSVNDYALAIVVIVACWWVFGLIASSKYKEEKPKE